MQQLLKQLHEGGELELRQVEAASEFLLNETASETAKAEFLSALSEKGETPTEIALFVEKFLQHAIDPMVGSLALPGPTLDVCGTGGDKLDLFNVSTTAMFIAAAAGAIVMKHGNRGITSKSGGADVLEALGVRIDLPPEGFINCIEKAGVGFLFAPNYHPAFKAVAGVRKRLAAEGKRSIFNLIGPLLNPARPACQLVGVPDPALCPVFAEILQRLGRESAWVISGKTADGRAIDEISLLGSSTICKSGSYQDISDQQIHPEDFGMKCALLEEIQGGNAQENSEILKKILSGKATEAQQNIVILNAAAAITCAGLSDHIAEGIKIAREAISSGAALERLRLLQETSANY